MAISFVGSASGVNTATMPSHQAGDLILALTFRDGSTTIVTEPGDFTTVYRIGANSCAIGSYQKIAASSSETVGTFTNATALIVCVYRGVDTTNPISVVNISTAQSKATNTISYPAPQGMAVSDGTSWIVGMAGHRSINTSLETPPAGMTLRKNYVDSVNEASVFDTAAGVTGWPLKTVDVGGTVSGWHTLIMELLAEATTRRRVVIT